MKFLVLDGNSILNRAFYGIKMLSNKKGQMTNAIYGFLSTLQKLESEVTPDSVAIAFDLPSPTFRHKMYSEYKANRHGMPAELASQMPILKELLISLGYKLITCEGYEADDILGTFAKYCENEGFECVIATGDRDSLQLVSDKVNVRIAKTKFGKPEAELYDEAKVKEVYGVTPHRLIDVKALQGDSSDNIPGVRGIGEKTAKDLISKFGSVKNIYENLENLDIKDNLKTKLLSGKTDAFMSYDLGEINKNVPIEINPEIFKKSSPDIQKSKKILTDLEIFSFMDKFGLGADSNLGSPKIDVNFCNNKKSISLFLKKLESSKFIGFSAEIKDFQINKISVCLNGTKVYILSSEMDDFPSVLESVLCCKSTIIVVHNLKNLLRTLLKMNISFTAQKFDIMLAAHLLNPSANNYDIDRLAEEQVVASPDFSGVDVPDIDSVKNSYFCACIYENFLECLKEKGQTELLFNIEQPLAEVLADMENIGFDVDRSGIEKYGIVLGQDICNLQNKIYELAGMDFNINSPKQLGTVLFEKLALPKGKKGKTGYSTSAATLEKLKGMHEIIDLILEYRALSKLKSTYCDSMLKLIMPDGRIHSSFNQTETRTGRISSTEPNLQNIPVRTPRGRELRKYFVAKSGCMLIDADYSQIELRIMAHISKDENMINAFKTGEDIHTSTASQILNIPASMITPEMRFRAKAVNFGILYGMGAFSLAQDLKISRYEAQNYINRYLEHYSGVDEYMQQAIKSAKENGFAETIFHRRRYLPELESTNYNLRAFGERVARNMPIQGSAADIIKLAMINVYEKLKKEKFKSRLILQVHDELIIEAPEEEVEKVEKILKSEMKNAVSLCVPLEVHIAVGKTWFDAKD